jgi:O-antigen/teichoic acid export membrane protein
VWINLVSPFPYLPLFSREETRGLLFFGGNVTGVRLLWGLWSEADLLVAGRMLGANALGGYTVAKQLATLPLSKTASIVTQVAFPAFARLQADPESMRAHLLKSLGLLALIAFPVTWGISCVAPELVEVVLGRKWILAVGPLQILGIVMSVRLLSQFTSAVVVAAGRPDVDLANALVFTLLLPAGFIIGSHWGLLGLSLTWVSVFPVAFLWTMRASLKALGTTLGALARSVAMPAVAGVLMCLATASARWWMDATVGAAARMAVLVAVGAAVYCGFLLVFDRDNVKAAMRTLRAVVRGGRAEA